MNTPVENEDNISCNTNDIVDGCKKIFKNLHEKNQSERLRKKIIDAFHAKNEFHAALNAQGVMKKNQTNAIRRQKLQHRKTWKKAVRDWIDFRKITEPDFEQWHVREGLPRWQRVEIFTRAMNEKNLSFEEALEFCGYPRLSNKEKEMIRAKVPTHKKEAITRGETIQFKPTENIWQVDDDLSTIDDEENNDLSPRHIHPSVIESVEEPPPLPENMTTLDQAKQWYDEAMQRLEVATKDVNNAKAVLARIIYDQQAKLNKVCKDVFGENDHL